MEWEERIIGIVFGLWLVAFVIVCAWGITASRLWPWQL